MNNTILLLGGSAQQVVAIETAKAMGLGTVLCDYLPDNPGRLVADTYYNVSTTDVEAVVRVAKAERVGGVLAYASDPAALTAAIVAERMGLAGNPVEAVATLGEKHRFRRFLRLNGFPCPRAVAVSVSEIERLGTAQPLCGGQSPAAAIAALRLPIVVKPTDASGSKGVTRLDTLDGLNAALAHAARYSRNQTLIVEEWIERGFPHVIGGDIFVADGEIRLFGEMACLRDAENPLLPIGERRPAGLNATQTEALHRELRRVVTLLGIRQGEMNIELLLDRHDRPHFLELGPRAGGNMIPLQLADATGIDLVRANICAAMGWPVSLTPQRREGCFCTFVLHSHSAGTFLGIDIAPELVPRVYRRALYKRPGDMVEAFDGAGKALGILFMRFPTEAEMLNFCSNPDNYIKVKTTPAKIGG